MKLHANAPLGPKGRGVMVRRVVVEGWSLMEAAEAAGMSERRCREWVRRYRAEGEAGLVDRSSAPKRVHNRTPQQRVEVIAALRRIRLTGPEIAELLEMATSTISAVLKRIGLGKLSRLQAPEPIRRYEMRRPGELIHVDVKKLGRIGPHGAGHRVLGRSWAEAGPSRDGREPMPPGSGDFKRAGSESTSASMTPPASPTPRSWPTRPWRRRSAFWSARSPFTAPTGSRSKG